jgi:AraC-like DNA-binding protein
LRYIEAYSHKPDLDVDTLARMLGCSRAKLYRVFGQQGVTVFSVLRNVRLEKACRLIEKSPLDTQISTVAYACGFADPSSFGKTFKAQYGLSPREWRMHSSDISRIPLR